MAAANIVLLFSILASSLADPATNLMVNMSKDGSYSVGIKGDESERTWFTSGPTMVMQDDHLFSTEDGSLVLLSAKPASGSDGFGHYTGMSYSWACGRDQDQPAFQTDIRQYTGRPGLVQFVQTFMTSVKNSNGEASGVLSSFPTLYTNDTGKDIGFTTYAGAQVADVHFGLWNMMSDIPGGLDGGMPLVLFDSKLHTTMVLSASSRFMAGSQALVYTQDRRRVYGFGVLGSVTFVPSGYEYSTMLYAGSSGITASVLEWGSLLLGFYNKTSEARLGDVTINYLGYWTDNGACYYYYKGDFPNYEDTMVAIHDDAVNRKLPYAYLQLDSWWYNKGYNEGVKNWTANATVFPDGVAAVASKTKLPLVGHNKYWATDTNYAKQNGGKFDFIMGETEALPNGPEFWTFLLSTAHKEWGLIMYEQDWLHVQTAEFAPLKESATLGEQWLTDMGKAASASAVTVQYCSPYPRHLLQSVAVPAVTQTRVSGDYHPGGSQWAIGETTLLAHALGLAAFKDTFHTVTEEKNCRFTSAEPASLHEAVVAALSGGPVGPSDSIGLADTSLVMATCMKDGRLLKPTRPAMSHDLTYVQRAFTSGGPRGDVWVGYTVVSNQVYYYLLAAEVEEAFSFTFDMLPGVPNMPAANTYVAYTMDYFHGNVTSIQHFVPAVGISIPTCGTKDFKLWILAPVVDQGGVTFLGEMKKIVSVSETRFPAMTPRGATTELFVNGAPGETVYVAMVYSGTRLFNLRYAACTIPQSGKATWTIPFGKCA